MNSLFGGNDLVLLGILQLNFYCFLKVQGFDNASVEESVRCGDRQHRMRENRVYCIERECLHFKVLLQGVLVRVLRRLG